MSGKRVWQSLDPIPLFGYPRIGNDRTAPAVLPRERDLARPSIMLGLQICRSVKVRSGTNEVSR